MEKYYFKTDGYEFRETCTEPCNAVNGVFIGSIKCRECKHCIDHNYSELNPYSIGTRRYIICDIIEQATGKER